MQATRRLLQLGLSTSRLFWPAAGGIAQQKSFGVCYRRALTSQVRSCILFTVLVHSPEKFSNRLANLNWVIIYNYQWRIQAAETVAKVPVKSFELSWNFYHIPSLNKQIANTGSINQEPTIARFKNKVKS